MNSHSQNPIAHRSSPGGSSSTGEDTLRLIAGLPAPAGLEDRVRAGVLASPQIAARTGRVLSWPAALRPESGWMRGAAAAAIVFVVTGGGWGVYSRVEKPQPANVIVLPHGSAPRGFSNDGAMRTPNTLNGPVLTHPVTTHPALAKLPAKASKRPTPPRGTQAATAGKAVTPQAK
jgi:hypothetical protein